MNTLKSQVQEKQREPQSKGLVLWPGWGRKEESLLASRPTPGSITAREKLGATPHHRRPDLQEEQP